MKCIFCGGKAEVKDSAQFGKDVYRKRVCADCNMRFHTKEKMIPETDPLLSQAFKKRYEKSPEQKVKQSQQWEKWYSQNKEEYLLLQKKRRLKNERLD